MWRDELRSANPQNMLTIFTIPKPFDGHIGIIQENAIASWVRLRPACEVILCGDDKGTAAMATKFKVKHLPNILRNEYGTPYVSSAFEQAQSHATHDLMCYVNADIVILSDLIGAVSRVQLTRFLMVGERIDLDLTTRWDYEQPNWEQKLRTLVADKGLPHPPLGSDYFVFPKHDPIADLPQFAVGRPGWDNWFIYNARALGVAVIDASKAAKVIHQNHGYGHVPARRDDWWEGPEADLNRGLIGGEHQVFTLLDATHVMTPHGPRPTFEREHVKRRLETQLVLSSQKSRLVRFIDRIGWRLRGYLAS